MTVFKSSLLVITLVSIYRKKSTRCTALSVWNVVKDRRASEKINFRPESECKGKAKNLPTKIFCNFFLIFFKIFISERKSNDAQYVNARLLLESPKWRRKRLQSNTFFFNYANFNAKKIITIIELFCIAQGFNELQVEKFYCRFPSLIYSVWYSSKIKHKYAYLQFNRHYLYLV